MNTIQMHNLIRTFLDEHRTVRWESDDIDDIINYVIKEIVNESLESDGRLPNNKFEAVGKIRNELYPLLVSKYPLLSAEVDDSVGTYQDYYGVNYDDFPSNLRQIVRVGGYFHNKTGTYVGFGDIDGITDPAPGMPDKALVSIDSDALDDGSSGYCIEIRDKYYMLASASPAGGLTIINLASDVSVGDTIKVYSANYAKMASIDYVTRNEYTNKVLKDPFQKVNLDNIPRRVYYYTDNIGLRFTCENTTWVSGVIYIDYIKEPTEVYGGVEYGPETDAGDALPAVADQDYIAVTEAKIGGDIYQPGEEFILSSGTITYGVVAHDFANCDLPESIHEEIVKKSTMLIGMIPEKQNLLKYINSKI